MIVPVLADFHFALTPSFGWQLVCSSCLAISSFFCEGINSILLPPNFGFASAGASCSSISSCFYFASNSRRSICFAFDDLDLIDVLLLFKVALTDPLLLCSGNTFTSLTELITSEGLDTSTTSTTWSSSSVTLLDCGSDFISLATSTEQLRFVGLKLLCLSFLVQGHLNAAFVETPGEICRSLFCLSHCLDSSKLSSHQGTNIPSWPLIVKRILPNQSHFDSAVV